jgi:hypothetical protein
MTRASRKGLFMGRSPGGYQDMGAISRNETVRKTLAITEETPGKAFRESVKRL